MKVLVVDDDLTTRIVLVGILSPFAEVDSCCDGNQAVQACSEALERGQPYDLVCLDLTMPNMSGLEALKLIRQEEQRHGRTPPRGARIIVATAADDKNTISQAFRQPCDAYIVKPIDAAELLNLVYCLCPID